MSMARGIFTGKLWSLSNSWWKSSIILLLFMICIKAFLNPFTSCPKRPVLFPRCRIYNILARYVTEREIRHLRGRKSGALCLPWDWVGQPFLRQLPRLRINQGLLTITQVRLSQNTTWSSFIFYLLFQISARKEKIIVKLSKTFFQLQNLNQTSESRQNLNLKILTKHSFTISTTIELHNHNQASYQ